MERRASAVSADVGGGAVGHQHSDGGMHGGCRRAATSGRADSVVGEDASRAVAGEFRLLVAADGVPAQVEYAPGTAGTDNEVFMCAATDQDAAGGSIGSRVRTFFESLGDAARGKAMHDRSCSRPGKFNTPFLRQLFRHVVLSTWTGLSRTATADIYHLVTSTPLGVSVDPRSNAAVVKNAFKTPRGFVDAVLQERRRLVHLDGWMETVFTVFNRKYLYMYRNGLDVILRAFCSAPKKYLFTPAAVGVPSSLVGPSRGAAFELYEREVRRTHGDRAFVLPFTLYSDGLVLPNSGAYSAHPLRLRLDCLDPDNPVWHYIGAIPQVFSDLGPGAADQATAARREVLQRAIYTALRDVLDASIDGVEVDLGADGKWMAFLRLVCYSCDYPEGRTVLCLRGVGCIHLCSSCMVRVTEAGGASSAKAPPRDAFNTVTDQLSALHLAASTVRGSTMERDRICDLHSCNPFPPALAVMAGFSTPPNFLRRIMGFDRLHVR